MARSDRIELFRSKASGDWWWRLRRANGRIIAGSAEGYKRPGRAREMATYVVNAAGPLEIVTVDE